MNDESNALIGRLAHLLEQEMEGTAKKPRVNWEKLAVGVQYSGKGITLPAEPGKMPPREAAKALIRIADAADVVSEVMETFDAFPLEALVAFNEAMLEAYNWTTSVPIQTRFGPIPPDLLTVQIDVDEYRQVPHGAFKVPGIKENLQTHIHKRGQRQVLSVIGHVKEEEKAVLLDLAIGTRRILKERSIYRGKALHIKTNPSGNLDLNNPPTFTDVRKVKTDELILNDFVQKQINKNLFGPIVHTARARKGGMSLKRGVLLEGPFGVGKTLATRVTARLCVDNGWTFIEIDRGESLVEALHFALRYQPCVVFCEDLDRTMSTRTDQANDLLNKMGSIISKDHEIVVVFTTNFVDRIEQAMLRPGRLDAIITIDPPDAKSIERLIHHNAGGLLAPDQDLTEVCKELTGTIPAVVQEVVDRSKYGAFWEDRELIIADDLLVTAKEMAAHRRRLEPKATAISEAEQLAKSLRAVISNGAANEDRFEEVSARLQLILDQVS